MKWKKKKNSSLNAFLLTNNRATFFVALFFFTTIINANTSQQKSTNSSHTNSPKCLANIPIVNSATSLFGQRRNSRTVIIEENYRAALEYHLSQTTLNSLIIVTTLNYIFWPQKFILALKNCQK